MMPKVDKTVCIISTMLVMVLLFVLARRTREGFEVEVVPPDASFFVKKLELSMLPPSGEGSAPATAPSDDGSQAVEKVLSKAQIRRMIRKAIREQPPVSADASGAATSNTPSGQAPMMTSVEGSGSPVAPGASQALTISNDVEPPMAQGGGANMRPAPAAADAEVRGQMPQPNMEPVADGRPFHVRMRAIGNGPDGISGLPTYYYSGNAINNKMVGGEDGTIKTLTQGANEGEEAFIKRAADECSKSNPKCGHFVVYAPKNPGDRLTLKLFKAGMYQTHPPNKPGPNVFRRVKSSKCASTVNREEKQKDENGKVTKYGTHSWYFRSTGSSPGDHFKWACTQSDGARARKAKIDAGQPLTEQEQRMEDRCKRVGADCGFEANKRADFHVRMRAIGNGPDGISGLPTYYYSGNAINNKMVGGEDGTIKTLTQGADEGEEAFIKRAADECSKSDPKCGHFVVYAPTNPGDRLTLKLFKMGMYLPHPSNKPGPNVFRRVRSGKCARKIEAEESQRDATGKLIKQGLHSWYFRSTGSSPDDHFKWACTQSDGAKARKAKIDAGQPLTAQEQRMEDKCKRVGADCGF